MTTGGERVLSGRYRVDDLIGQGGMASVFRGYDVKLDRPVAIKILAPALTLDETFRARFRLEAQAASRMSHPTIVRVFDAGEDREVDAAGDEHAVPYIVMELVEGKTLKQVIDRGPVEPATTVRYMNGILDALAYSHRAGVVHRDIKPGNIMITPLGGVKVMDFGIARAVSDSSSTVAETTQIIGTAAYFSPEQAKGEPVDARTDLYSAGVVLFELLTGRQPFRGETAVAVAYQHVSETAEAPSQLDEDIPAAIDAVVARALSKNPHERYQSASEFRAALDAAADPARRDDVTPSGRVPVGRGAVASGPDLFAPDARDAGETARDLRRLTTAPATARAQPKPVIWAWIGIAVLAAAALALLMWLVLLRPNAPVSTERTVPDVSQMSYEQAEKALTALGLSSEQHTEASDTIPADYVVRSDPAADESVEVGTVVKVYVSTGKQMTDVPTLSGMTQDAATTALQRDGLAVGTITTRDAPGLAAGTVISVDPGEGTSVAAGSSINLVVASGNVLVADLTGSTMDRGLASLAELKLQSKREDDPSCKATNPATVSRMSVAPGAVPVTTEVTLYACSGE